MEWQARKLELTYEMCSQHTWQRTRSSRIIVCSTCWAAGRPGEQTTQYRIPLQPRQLALPQEICAQHDWHPTRNSAIAVCSICWMAGKVRSPHTLSEHDFTGEQVQPQDTSQHQNILPAFASHPDASQRHDVVHNFATHPVESDQEKQTDQLLVEHEQGKKESEQQPEDKNEQSPARTQQLKTFATGITILATIVGLFWQVFQFNAQQATNAQMQATQVAANAAQTLDQEQQATFDNYLDRMSDLLLNDKLQNPPQGSPVIAIAEARTLTALRDLDSSRRSQLVRFLWKAQLDTGSSPVISLNAALLSYTMFQHALLYNINFSKTLLIGSTFDDCDLSNAIFTGAALPGALLNNVNLAGAIMSGANLYGATLKLASLNGANLTNALLQNANLSADDLTQTILIGAVLTGVNLTNALLQGANLSGDDLTHTNLRGANLAGAFLKGARITSAELTQVASLQGTIMPDGSTHP